MRGFKNILLGTVIGLQLVFMLTGCSTMLDKRQPQNGEISNLNRMLNCEKPGFEDSVPYREIKSKLESFRNELGNPELSSGQVVRICGDMVEYLRLFKIRNADDPKSLEFADRLIKNIGNIARRKTRRAELANLEQAAGMIGVSLSERVSRYGKLKDCIDSALSDKALWSDSELNDLRSKLRDAKRMYYGGICTLALKAAKKRFQETDDPEFAINICGGAVRTVEKTLARKELWSFDERCDLHRAAAEFKRKKQVTEKEFADLIRQTKELLRRDRVGFANKRAALDLKSAKELYERERSKWFNWGWMGYPRDNRYNLCRSIRLLQRVKASQYTSMILCDESARIFNEVEARFSDSELQELDSYPMLSKYSLMWDFPNWDPLAKARYAWGVNRKREKSFRSEKM